MYVCNFSKPKTTDEYSHSMLAYFDSTAVRVFEANAAGFLFWIRAAPSPIHLHLCELLHVLCGHSRLVLFLVVYCRSIV